MNTIVEIVPFKSRESFFFGSVYVGPKSYQSKDLPHVKVFADKQIDT